MILNTSTKNNLSLPAIFLSPSQERSGGGSSNTPLQPQKIDGRWQLATLSAEALKIVYLLDVAPNKIAKYCKSVENDIHSQYLSDGDRESENNSKSEEDHKSKDNPKKVDIGIDYLMGILKLSSDKANSFLAYLSQVFDCKLDFREYFISHGCYDFHYIYESPISGLKIYYEMNEDTTVTLALIAPGKSLRPLSMMQILEFIVRAFVVYRCKFTRIDVRVDDYKKRSNIRMFHNLAKKGDVAGVTKRAYMESGVVGDGGRDEAETLYLGSKRTGLRIYNAELLHDIPAYRWEGVFREERCITIINRIVGNFEDFPEDPMKQLAEIVKYLGNKVMDIAKFIKRKKDTKQAISRYQRYSFYKSLIKDIGEIDPELLKDEPKPKLNSYEFVMKSFEWLNKQVFKRLELLRESFGINFDQLLDECLKSAKDRYSNADDIRQEEINDFIKNIPQHNLKEFTKQLIPA